MMKSRKTIAYLVFNTKENTGNKIVFQQLVKFAKKGYIVRAYYVVGGNPDWIILPNPAKHFLYSFFEKKADILVATFWPTTYLVYLMKGVRKYFFVQEWEEDFYNNSIIKFFARFSFRMPLTKIVISNSLKKRIERYNPAEKIIYNIKFTPLDTSIFSPRTTKLKSDKFINVLSVISWYNQHKGPDLLVESIRKLKKISPNYQFTLVSREKYTLTKEVDFFYSNPTPRRLSQLYKKSDILLVTSRSEGFFIPGLEAMASGCIVITTNCHGILEYVKHKVNGWILNDLSDIWKKSIIEKLMKDKSLNKKLRSNGYKTAQQFSQNNLITEIEEIFFRN